MTQASVRDTPDKEQSTAAMLSWLGATTARLLECADEASLTRAVYDAIHHGLGLDRVGLVLLSEQRDEWFWVLCCDAGGQLYSWPERYPVKTLGQYINLERFSGGAAVSYVPDLWALLTPQQRAHEESTVHENLAVALRRTGKNNARAQEPGAPDDADLVGFLSVDNLPSGRPLAPSLPATLAVFGQVLAQAIESVRLRQSERAARQAAERHAAREAALAELIAFVNTSLLPTVVAQRAAATVRMICDGADEVWLWMVSDERRTLDLLATDGAPDERAGARSSLPLDGDSYIIARVLRDNKAAFFENMADVIDTWPSAGAQYARDYAAGFIAMLPLADAEDVVGVLGLSGQKPRIFPREDRAFLRAVAGHVGTALGNARFAARQQRNMRRTGGLLELARALNRLGSVDDVLERAAHMAAPALNCSACSIYLLEDDGAHYALAVRAGNPDGVELTPRQRRPPADWPELLPLRAGEPVVLDRTTAWQGPYATILLPLRRDELTFGFLALIEWCDTRHFEPEEIAIGQSMAEYITTAIENTRLYLAEREGRATAERRASEMDALVAGAHLLIGAATPSELAESGVRTAVASLQADAGWAIACTDTTSPQSNARMLSSLGLPDRTAASREGASPEELVATHSALRRAPVTIFAPDDSAADIPALHIGPHDLQSYAAVPLIAFDRLVGALGIGALAPRRWSDDEVALVQAIANQMAAGLEAARLREEAAHAKAAREADRLKDELLATVSHELRTPLGTIKGFATALLEYDAFIDPQERRSFLHLIDDASDRLRALVNDLLDAGRMESRGVRLALAPVDLKKLLRDTIRDMGPRLSGRPIRVRIGGDVPSINGDVNRLRQVLQNLLENAVKYSAEPNSITISVSHDADELRVRVLDRGIGIPAEHLTRVFERFHRVDNSSTRSVGGTGLGLAIARGIIEAHGGCIWAESKGEGRGTTITFTLPLKRGG